MRRENTFVFIVRQIEQPKPPLYIVIKHLENDEDLIQEADSELSFQPFSRVLLHAY